MSASQDYVALDWIKGEIGQTLQQAQQALEMVAQTPDDLGSLRACLTSIHQVNGTLQMVQLMGPTQVAQEMEHLAQALMNNEVPDVGRAQEMLMQSILQMPAYLDRIHREQADAESNYMPIVNNLRVARGEERIATGGSEKPSGPSLTLFLTPGGDDAAAAYANGNGAANLPKLRHRYQQALVAALKKTDLRENLTLVGRVFAMLTKLCGASPVGYLCHLGLACIEGITTGAIKLDANTANLLRAVDKILKRLSESGADALDDQMPEALVLGFIGVIEGASKQTPKIIAAKTLYESESATGEEEPRGVSIGPDDETLAAVAKILKEELTTVTDKLDLFVRSSARSDTELVELLPMLEQISSTLMVVGLAQHQETVGGQVAVIKAIQESGTSPDDDQLLDMAGALLEIERTLGVLAGETDEGGADAFGDLNDAQAAVIRETRVGLAQCKDALIEFVSSGFDHTQIDATFNELMALRGGLLIANQERSGDVLVSAARYVRVLVDGKRQPELVEMDDLADAVTSVDYYLERLLESANDPYVQMIEVAEEAVEKLGFPVGVEPAEPEVEPAVEIEPVVATQPSVTVEVEEAAVEGDDLIDDEILEIFVEEAEEVLETIAEYLPQWQQDYSNGDALTEIRRAFHTLKGSGRMVGATVLGELAWSIENMLNRVMDNSISPGDEMLTLISSVTQRLPEGVEAFKNGDQEAFEVQGMVDIAEALASGQEVGSLQSAPAEEAEQEPLESDTIDLVVEEESGIDEIEAPEDESLALEDLELEAVDQQPDVSNEVADDVAEVSEAIEEEVEEIEEELLEEEPGIEEIEEEPLEEVSGIEEIEAPDDESLEMEDLELEATDQEPDDTEVSVETLAEEPLHLVEVELDTAAEEVDEPGVEADTLDEREVEQEAEPSLELEDLDLEEISLEADPEDETSRVGDESSLDEIFIVEARENIGVIKSFLDAPGIVEGDIPAAFHTLKGSAAMAEIPTINQIAAPLERLAGEQLSKNADEKFIARIRRGTNLMEQVLGDLSLYRDRMPGVEEFIRQFATATEPAPVFRFDGIQRLSSVTLSSDTWSSGAVGILVAELVHAKEQAVEYGQENLLRLVEGLLSAYGQLPEPPGDAAIVTLQAAHDELLTMFDQIAASQIVDVSVTVDQLQNLVPLPSGAPGVPPAPAVELPTDDVDEDILPIFLEEAEELMEGIDESILEWSESPEVSAPLDNLLRHLHTLKGGSRMAGLNSLGEYTHNFESYLIGIQSKPGDLDVQFFARLNQEQDEITRRIEIYQKLANGEATDDELTSMRDSASTEPQEPSTTTDVEVTASTPAAVAVQEPETIELPADHVDDDILPIFLEETEELLEGIDESIQSWSEAPASSEHLDNLLRHLHTMKGGSRMAGLNSLGEYTHNFESYLIGIQNKPVELNEQFFALVNQHQDEITRRVEIYTRLASGEASGEELASLMTATTTTEADSLSGDSPQSVEEPVQEAEAEQDKQGTGVAAQEMVRVSADLLEELIGLAGESSINRGRIEQQISDFGDALEEMEDTINRIRDQVRRLEIEAESRETLIQQTGDGDSSFDELEMDRYTMLQEISRTLSEGSSDMLDLKDTLVNRSQDTETLLHQQARIASELQEGLTRTRMVPFAKLIPRLRRIVRQVSGEVGKSVRFDAFNVEGELDRSVLDRIVAPLEHMLRNAVDHGVESAEKRLASGKSEQVRISLRLSREGGYVILTISDDGGGIAVDAVRTKAIERGLISADSQVSDREVMQFIMHAGFSTAQKLTQISGRGVGMDVVGSEIKALGGSMTIDSTLGVGTEFTISIPFTVSINRALMVVVREETYAVPLNTIEGIVRVSPYELEAYYQPDAPLFEYAGQPYRLQYMGQLLDRAEQPNLEGLVAPLPVILARSGDHAVALQVDRVIGSREVVVKTLGPQFNEVGGISGATVLGDGSVVIILDVMALVRSHEAHTDEGEETEPEVHSEIHNKVRTVMIVDDSVTVRKVTSRLLERQGWEVATAKDGLDAVTQLQDIYPDVVLLDIEMPKMDGFEVLRRVRGDERLKNLPIIMITSRTGEKHRQQALELGVNEYLGKPFQEASLISTIEEVIEGSGGA